MLAVPMAAQVDLALERLVAEAALEGLVAGVLAHVRDQVGALAERLLADDARVRFLAWRWDEIKRNGHSVSRGFWWNTLKELC